MEGEKPVQQRIAARSWSAAERKDFEGVARSAFFKVIGQADYPCLGAKAALHAGSLKSHTVKREQFAADL